MTVRDWLRRVEWLWMIIGGFYLVAYLFWYIPALEDLPRAFGSRLPRIRGTGRSISSRLAWPGACCCFSASTERRSRRRHGTRSKPLAGDASGHPARTTNYYYLSDE